MSVRIRAGPCGSVGSVGKSARQQTGGVVSVSADSAVTTYYLWDLVGFCKKNLMGGCSEDANQTPRPPGVGFGEHLRGGVFL